MNFLEFLKKNPYPGRGIAVGRNRVYYFIMGRSENSRNRIFVETEDGIRTEAFDPAKVVDPSLIIYHPVRRVGGDLIVTNGDQTDTIRDIGDFQDALMTREYEPDDPNFTPRISAVLHEDGSFCLSILKRIDGRCLRPGSPLPSFQGEPLPIDMPEPEAVWEALNEDNKVSLYTYVDGEVKIFNKNQK